MLFWKRSFGRTEWIEYLSRYLQTVDIPQSHQTQPHNTDDTIPAIMRNEMSAKEARRGWARLIQKIYEVDPLVCPKCQGKMKNISIIDDFEIIDKILTPFRVDIFKLS